MAERSADPRPSVDEALESAPVQRGAPEVVAGRDHLDRSVRWVHVAEARDVASVLRGGELLITEGGPFQGFDADQRRFVAELSERGIAGVILELGTHFQSVPADLISAFDEHELRADRTSRPGALHRGHRGDQHVDRRLPVGPAGPGRGDSAPPDRARAREARASASCWTPWPRRSGIRSSSSATPAASPTRRGAGHSERDVFAAWERFTHGLPDAPEVIERRAAGGSRASCWGAWSRSGCRGRFGVQRRRPSTVRSA